jgi:hypothetical protein
MNKEIITAIKILKILKQSLYAEDRVLLMRALSLCIRLLEKEEREYESKRKN